MNKFKVGDKVIANGKETLIKHYVPTGTITTIAKVWSNGTYVDVAYKGQTVHIDQLDRVNANKIVIIPDGNKTIARLYNDNKVIKSAEAKCNATDTYDFAIGAKLAFDRLMPSEPKKAVVEEKKTEDKQYREVKRAAKAGDTVRIVGNHVAQSPDGSIRKVVRLNTSVSTSIYVRVDNPTDFGSPGDGNVALADIDEYVVLEPITQPTEDKHVYKVGDKAKCVKQLTNEKYFTVGNVYEIDANGGITNDNGFTYHDEPRGTGVDWLIRLGFYQFEPYTEPTTPKEPTYYNGKVVCVESLNDVDEKYFTVGKVYEFIDGVVVCNCDVYNQYSPSMTKDDALNELYAVKFIEYKGIFGEAL